MSDQNTILPDILTDETKIFILSTEELISDSLYNQQFSSHMLEKSGRFKKAWHSCSVDYTDPIENKHVDLL